MNPTSEESGSQATETNCGSNISLAPNNDYRMEEMTKLLETFCKAVTPAAPPPPKPESFTGDVYQDPQVFLTQLETHLDSKQLTPQGTVRHIADLLGGEAATWFQHISEQVDSYDCFRRLFLERYCTDEREDTLHALLYGEEQKQQERAVPFILRKERLYRRLRLNWEDKRTVSLITRQLTPDYRIMLGPHPLASVEELRRACAEIDEYIHGKFTEQRNESKKSFNKPFVRRNLPDTSQPKRPARPIATAAPAPGNSHTGPPSCQYCPERHWHRDCPVLRARWQPSGEERRVGASRT